MNIKAEIVLSPGGAYFIILLVQGYRLFENLRALVERYVNNKCLLSFLTSIFT